MRWLWLLLLVPWLASAGDSIDSNGENRCDDLGSGCLCAESMNANDGTVANDTLYNPTNSTSKQCNGGSPIYSSNGAQMVQLSDAANYTGPTFGSLSTSNYVIRGDQSVTGGGGVVLAAFGSAASCSNCTLCTRWYVSQAPNYAAPPNSSFRHKWIRPGRTGTTPTGMVNSGMEWHQGSNPGFDASMEPSGWFGSGFNDPPNSPDLVTFDDLKTHTHRTEFCTDHNSSTCCGVSSGGTNRLCVRFRLVDIVNGDSTEECYTSTASLSQQTWAGAANSLLDWYDQSAPSGGAQDWQYMAYLMYTQTSVDSTFWIGSADEIEGAGAPTWTISSFNFLLPSTCVQGSCSDLADITSSASGTCADGTINWGIDCDTAGGYVEENTLTACNNSSTCNVANVCDYSGKVPATYTAEIRSDRSGGSCTANGSLTTTFTVQSPSGSPGSVFTGTSVSDLYRDPYDPVEWRVQ